MEHRASIFVRLLLVAGVLLPLVDLALVAVFAAQHPDYSHLRQLMSELGEEGRPGSTSVNAWFTFSSCLLVAFGLAMGRQLPQSFSARVAVICFLVWAVLGIVAGLFPCDAGCEGRTLAGRVHLLAGEIGMAAMLPVPGLVWFGVRHEC